MDQQHTSMVINLILNLPRDYLTQCCSYSKKQLSNRWFFFQCIIKNIIMLKDTSLKNNNELSNNFVTNLESYKRLKKQV